MGMYDYITLKAPIEGGLPPWIDRNPFQTKDTPAQYLETYTIAEDGTFSDPDFTGTLFFYTSNVVGTGPGIYTINGEDAEYIECKAVLLHGKLVEPIEVHRNSEPAWPSSRQKDFPDNPLPQRTAAEQKERDYENMVGKWIYVLWGGQDKGYWATVVYENTRTLCIKHEVESKWHMSNDLELIDRRDRDRIFWDSEDEALSRHRTKQQAWDTEVKAFKEYQNQRGTK